MEDKHSSTIPTLLCAFEKHPNKEYISLGDYNLHHLIWGGPDIPHTNQEAIDLMHFMQERNKLIYTTGKRGERLLTNS